MDSLIVEGPARLSGEIQIDGSKNATLPIMAACLLSDEKSVIRGVPSLTDVFTMIEIMRHLGVKIKLEDDVLTVVPDGYKGNEAPYNYVSTMRASICVLGPLLAKTGYAKVSLPGGCVIGPRPIDLHTKGIKALGADVKVDHGYLIARAKGLKGASMHLCGVYGSSVLATANIMMAATLAKGRTVIESAACEPEVVDLAEFLIKMGARIRGHGSHTLEIEGVKRLYGAEHHVIPDRIEAGTYMIAASITRGDVLIKGCEPRHISALIDKLSEIGVSIKSNPDASIRVRAPRSLKAVDITTLPYPGFPTDLQAQITALMSTAQGTSVISEKIYPERFMHLGELNRMGAQAALEGDSAIIKGVKSLSGAQVMASDLRASAALVIGGLVARGETQVSRIYHLDRGYSNMEAKLSKLGAKIRRIKGKQ